MDDIEEILTSFIEANEKEPEKLLISIYMKSITNWIGRNFISKES